MIPPKFHHCCAVFSLSFGPCGPSMGPIAMKVKIAPILTGHIVVTRQILMSYDDALNAEKGKFLSCIVVEFGCCCRAVFFFKRLWAYNGLKVISVPFPTMTCCLVISDQDVSSGKNPESLSMIVSEIHLVCHQTHNTQQFDAECCELFLPKVTINVVRLVSFNMEPYGRL